MNKINYGWTFTLNCIVDTRSLFLTPLQLQNTLLRLIPLNHWLRIIPKLVQVKILILQHLLLHLHQLLRLFVQRHSLWKTIHILKSLLNRILCVMQMLHRLHNLCQLQYQQLNFWQHFIIVLAACQTIEWSLNVCSLNVLQSCCIVRIEPSVRTWPNCAHIHVFCEKFFQLTQLQFQLKSFFLRS